MRSLPKALVNKATSQDGLFTRLQALDAGMKASTLEDQVGHRIVRVLPTVYAAFTGALLPQQRFRAAVLYGRLGGDSTVAILGGLAACHVHGLRAAGAMTVDAVQLLLPRPRELAHSDFVVVRRAAGLGKVWQLSGLPLCSPARAIIDAARPMQNLDDVRALVAEGVQRGKTTVEQIAEELRSGGSAGSRLPRRVLAEVGDGVRSVAEAQLRSLLEARGFAAASWNPDLYDAHDEWLARPDAYWPEANLIAEVESREWHLSPADWAATMRRTNRLNVLGFSVQQFPPGRVLADPDSIVAEISAAYAAGLARMSGGMRSDITLRSAGST